MIIISSIVFTLITGALVLFNIVYAIISFKNGTKKGVCLGSALIFGSLTCIFYTLSIEIDGYFTMSLMSSLYFMCVSTTLFMLLMFILTMVEIKRSVFARVSISALFSLLIVDDISLFINPWYEFALGYIPNGNGGYTYDIHLPYTLHLTYSYILIAFCLIFLIRKAFSIPKMFRETYSKIALSIVLAIIINAAFLFLPKTSAVTFDYSIWLYSIIGLFSYFCAFNDNFMVEKFKNVILSNVDEAIVLFGYDNKLITVNARGRELLNKIDFDKNVTFGDFEAAYDISDDLVEYNDTSNFRIYNDVEKEDALKCEHKIVRDKSKRVCGHLVIVSKVEDDEDSLTGFTNYDKFKSLCASGANDYGYPITLVAFAVNDLTSINKQYLRHIGDQVIVKLSNAIKESFPDETIFVRYRDARLVAMIRGKDKLSHIKEYIDDTFHSFDKDQPWDFYPTCQYGMHVVQNSGSYILDGLKAASESLTVKKLLDANSYRSQMVLSLRQTLRECDEDTEEHVLRTQIMGRELGKKLGLTDLEQGYLALLCVLHDVGKVAIPLEILNKPGKLTESEWEIMKSHARKGYTIAKSSPSLAPIADYILSHHERWDGKGYPLGSSGENVPLLSRIISIVDAYDAMTNDRVYRKAMPKLKALEILKECAGTQFDPNIVKVFVEMKWDEALEQTQELDKPVDEYDVSKRSGETTSEHVMPVVNANYTLDDQNYIVSIDETFTYLTGYTMDDVKELHLRQLDLIPEEDRDIYDNQVNEQLKKDNIAIITHRVKKKHGGFMTVLCSGQLRFDPVTKRNSSFIRISRIDDILRQVNQDN